MAHGCQHRVLFVSDFFFPAVGGVESHIYHLSHCLVQQGHKAGHADASAPAAGQHVDAQLCAQVVVLTHCQGQRTGVRWLANGVKVKKFDLLSAHTDTSQSQLM